MKMTKEDKVFNYLMDNIKIDINTLERILEQPKEALDLYGGIRKWYISSCPHFSECEKAIEYAKSHSSDEEEQKSLALAYIAGANDYAWMTLDSIGISKEDYKNIQSFLKFI